MPKPMSMGQLPGGPVEEIEDVESRDVASLQAEIAELQAGLDAPAEAQKYVENEDGSVDVMLDDDAAGIESEAFDENLALILPETDLDALGRDLVELIEADIEARSKRDKQYADGIKRTGMGGEAPGGADFEGASKAVHPMLTKACVDFASRAIKELFPANGPCKTQIIGEQTEEKVDRAERKKKFMNWQATTQIEENRSELEKLLSQVPLGGAQYKRWWYDPELKRNRTEAVFIDNVFTPYGHSDFYTSPRTTHRQRILRSEYEARVRTGLYRELNLSEDTFLMTEESEAQQATDKVEGVDPDAMAYNEDGLRLIYQVEVQQNLEDDPLLPEDRVGPYIIHIDASSKKILGLYRNWKEGDDRLRRKHWMSEWPFIPWRDGPAVGLAHIIGSLAGASTGALRAIIDAAQIANFPGGLMLAGGKTSGESVQVNATELKKINPPAGMTDPDIRKLVMAFPFNGPSAVLFSTLEWLTQQAEQVVATASEAIADAGADMPVGTAMALIEHGSANFSAIHARLHAAMKHDLEIQHRLNSEYMEDEETVEDLGELVVRREEFMGPMDIIPVSDPNIFSETQRYAQLQAVLQLKNDPAFMGFFKPEQLLARALKLLQIPDIEGIANLPKDAMRMDALDENYVASSAEEARPLKAYSDQDHVAHMKMHIQYATSPMLGANPLIASSIMPGMLQHCKEHLLMLYKQHTGAAIEAMRTVAKMRGLNIPDGDIQLYGASFAEQTLAELVTPMIMPGLEKMQQIVAQIGEASAPKPDPSIALQEKTKVEVKTMELKLRESEAAKDRQQQDLAAKIAAEVEQLGVKSQEGLAQLAANVQLVRDQQNNGAKQLQIEFQAAHQTQLTVLQEVLTAFMTGGATGGGTPGPDGEALDAPTPNSGAVKNLMNPLLGAIQASMAEALQGLSSNELMDTVSLLAQQQDNLRGILEQERSTNAAAIQQLAAGVSTLMQLVNEPTEAEIYVGPDGKKRARRVRPQQGLPAPQQPPQEPMSPLEQGMQP